MPDNETDRLMGRAFVVLVRPQIPENIGAAARVAANMGLGGLVVVEPRLWDEERMLALATRIGREVITERTRVVGEFSEALAGFGLVIGATARVGRFRRPVDWPRSIMEEAAGFLAQNKVALVFGPEKDGLTTPELELCRRHVRIPAVEETSSLNLAQAVAVLAYELRMAVLANREQGPPRPALATSAELEGMYGHLDEVLDTIDPEVHLNRKVWLNSLRGLLDRAHLRPHEIKILRGIFRKINWAVDHRPPAGISPDRNGTAVEPGRRRTE